MASQDPGGCHGLPLINADAEASSDLLKTVFFQLIGKTLAVTAGGEHLPCL